MKKFKVAALLMCFVALSMAMTSCSKSNEDLIIGQWECTEISGDDASVSGGVGAVYEFKSDNTFSITYQNISAGGTYSIDEDVLNITVSVTVMGQTFSETSKLTIKSLDKSSMVLASEDGEDTATFSKL